MIAWGFVLEKNKGFGLATKALILKVYSIYIGKECQFHSQLP